MASDVSGVTYPRGFLASGVRAGIKEHGEDTALIFSKFPASAAGVFTTNVVEAAPVSISRSRLPSATSRAIVANSGNANACTGEQGLKDARAMTSHCASLLGVADGEVLVASTGIIGRPMPMDRVGKGISDAVAALNEGGWESAARAIMTTDTRLKVAQADLVVGGKTVRIGGMAKGAGMICPNVATMLAFITTDACITPKMLDLCLRRAADATFNCLTVDGDSSTNDTVIALANGQADNAIIQSEGEPMNAFEAGLTSVCGSLARAVASDGEGATKLVTVTVEGASSFEDARRIAKTVANSPLVKTAMFGCDPNWGRVLAAAGRAGVAFDPKSVELAFGDTVLVDRGEPVGFSESAVREYLSGSEVHVSLIVGKGRGSATVWTCDLTYDYVKINAEYHT